MVQLTLPIPEEKIRALRVGDEVQISGVLFTGRDAVHKYLHEGGKLPPEVNLRGGIIYHCVRSSEDEQGNGGRGGTNHSIREEPYQWQIIRFRLRGVIGKEAWERTLTPVNNTAAFTSTPSGVRRRCWRNASSVFPTFIF
jgi:fumarate hydratase class I